MGTFRDVQCFVHGARDVSSLKELDVLLEATIKSFGFQFYALGHHVNVVSRDQVQIGNYPASWSQSVHSSETITEDPVLRACQNTAVGFKWSDVGLLVELTARHKEILANARKVGMGEGYTVPIHIPGECTGSCSFAYRVGRKVNEAILPSTHYIGSFAFEAARRLVRHNTPRHRLTMPGEALTSRQLDCVVLVARGKSDWEAAQLLGLAQDTVHQHVETAKRKYGVATRTQLVIRALFDNQLGFEDVILR
jgi:LuxR family quorum-sensing system transcriptional regulator CciR